MDFMDKKRKTSKGNLTNQNKDTRDTTGMQAQVGREWLRLLCCLFKD